MLLSISFQVCIQRHHVHSLKSQSWWDYAPLENWQMLKKSDYLYVYKTQRLEHLSEYFRKKKIKDKTIEYITNIEYRLRIFNKCITAVPVAEKLC